MMLFATLTLVSALAAPQQAPPAPKPGAEHKLLTADAGTWDASSNSTPNPASRR